MKRLVYVATLIAAVSLLACQAASVSSPPTPEASPISSSTPSPPPAPAATPVPSPTPVPTLTPTMSAVPQTASEQSSPRPAAPPKPSFIDLHLHPVSGISFGEFITLMDRAGVSQAVIMPTGGDGEALEAAALFPDRFIPFAGGEMVRRLVVNEGRVAWRLESPRAQEYLQFLDQALAEGKFRGMGEVYTNHEASPGLGLEAVYFPTDSPLLLELLRLSAKHRAPLSVHMNFTSVTSVELEWALAAVSRGIFLWAHCGGNAGPVAIRPLLQKYPNLFCELSARDPDRYGSASPILRAGSIAPDWATLLEDFSDRFMIGVDADTPREVRNKFLPWAQYHLSYLEQLSPETGAKIREGNARRLLGLDGGPREALP